MTALDRFHCICLNVYIYQITLCWKELKIANGCYFKHSYNVVIVVLCSNEAELDLDAERPAKRARSDNDETDFTMASLAKGDVTQVIMWVV